MRLLNKAFEWLLSRRTETKGDKRSSHFSLFSFSLVTVHLSLLFAFALAPSAFALDGSQVVTGGGSVDFTGASSTNWVVNPDNGVAVPFGVDFLMVACIVCSDSSKGDLQKSLMRKERVRDGP